MNDTKLDALLAPAEFEKLPQLDLTRTSCVVFDVLRATSTMTVALANGAEAILPCTTIEEAVAVRKTDPYLLLAGERGGQRITAAVSGSLDFDLGNSPREMTADIVSGKRLATTTTNGTRALHACRGAEQVWLGNFLNLSALGQAIREADPQRLLLVCAGTGEAAALEDALGAGALCDLLWPALGQAASDSARLVCDRYRNCQAQLLQAASEAKNARHLLSMPALAPDVEFCLQQDTHPIVGKMNADGWVIA